MRKVSGEPWGKIHGEKKNGHYWKKKFEVYAGEKACIKFDGKSAGYGISEERKKLKVQILVELQQWKIKQTQVLLPENITKEMTVQQEDYLKKEQTIMGKNPEIRKKFITAEKEQEIESDT